MLDYLCRYVMRARLADEVITFNFLVLCDHSQIAQMITESVLCQSDSNFHEEDDFLYINFE